MSNKKTSAQKKFADRKKEAQRAAEPVDVEFRGKTYRIPAPDDWSLEAMELMADAEEKPLNAVKILRELLGEQWAKFKARNPKAADVGDFMEAFQKATDSKDGSGPN